MILRIEILPDRLRRGLLLLSAGWLACAVAAAAAPSRLPRADGHVVWVMPFQNRSAAPGLDWIGTSFPNIINERLSSAGLLTIRREDRRYALKHLGLPADFYPTLATTYRIAQTLDAEFVVAGTYTVANGAIQASARLLLMNGPRMASPIEEQGPLDQLIEIEDKLAWRIAKQMEPSLQLDEQTFLAAGRDLRLDAFENYIRGQVEPNTEQKIGHLSRAVQLSPNYVQAWFALGKAYFDDQQYERAEVPFSKVPRGNRLWLEAQFYSGLGHLYTGNYVTAQGEFGSIASVLPMPEVLNNEGIAINRRGQNGTAFFQRTVQLDSQNADYWFNLAVSERRRKDYAAALKAVERSIALRPHDEEAMRLRQNLDQLQDAPGGTPKMPDTANAELAQGENAATDTAKAASANGTQHSAAQPGTAETSADQDYEPLERIARSYDESSFRQAAFAMEQMNAMKLRAKPPSVQASLLSKRGTDYVHQGLLLEAQRQFQLALAADPRSAAAEAGLAEVHEYSGNVNAAQNEAAKSIEDQPNVAGYLVLARIALSKHSVTQAQQDVDHALAIDPKNTAAKGIQHAIQAQQVAH